MARHDSSFGDGFVLDQHALEHERTEVVIGRFEDVVGASDVGVMAPRRFACGANASRHDVVASTRVAILFLPILSARHHLASSSVTAIDASPQETPSPRKTALPSSVN